MSNFYFLFWDEINRIGRIPLFDLKSADYVSCMELHRFFDREHPIMGLI
jgi:hypothetical protein